MRCAYFVTPEAEMCREHLRYWAIIGFDSLSGTGDIKQFMELKDAVGRERTRRDMELLTRPQKLQAEHDAQSVLKVLPQLVLWNRYKVPSVEAGKIAFIRTHSVALDPFRRELQTIPVPTDFLSDENNPLNFVDKPTEAPRQFYELILKRYAALAGCGSAMHRNLLTLASLLADTNIKVALVTGEPGTGKENLCKAIYYGNKLTQPPEHFPEAIFRQTTAVQIQSAMRRKKGGKAPSEFLRDELSSGKKSTSLWPPVVLTGSRPNFFGGSNLTYW